MSQLVEYQDNELATIGNFPIVQIEEKRKVRRIVNHYNLQAIIAVGFKINEERAVHYRTASELIVEHANA